MASLSPTVEELATLDDDQAVASRLDVRNVRVFVVLLRVLVVVAAISAITAFATGRYFAAVVESLNVGLLATVMRVAGRVRRNAVERRPHEAERSAVVRAFARHPREVIVLVLVAELILLILATGQTGSAWIFTFPFVVLFFRFSTFEHLLLSGSLIAVSVIDALVAAVLGSGTAAGVGEVVAALAINLLVLGIALALSARARRSLMSEWQHAQERYHNEVRMRRELEAAREIQLSMLPRSGPDVAWIDAASLSLPAAEVGGDYYDYFVLGPRRMAVVSADVAGHGVAAGIMLSGVRSCLALLEDELSQPLDVLGRLDRMVKRTAVRRMFVTLSILLVDEESGSATVASAGHPPVLHYRASDRDVVELPAASLPLGSPLTGSYDLTTVRFEPGDLFLLYSDGLFETSDEDGEPYGLERVKEVVRTAASDATAKEVRDALIHELWGFKGKARQGDDITVVALRAR